MQHLARLAPPNYHFTVRYIVSCCMLSVSTFSYCLARYGGGGGGGGAEAP